MRYALRSRRFICKVVSRNLTISLQANLPHRLANYCPRPRSSHVNMRAPANPTAKGIQSSTTPRSSASNATEITPSIKSATITAKSPRASTRTTRTLGLSVVCHIRFGRASDDPGGMISGATLGRSGGTGRWSVIQSPVLIEIASGSHRIHGMIFGSAVSRHRRRNASDRDCNRPTNLARSHELHLAGCYLGGLRRDPSLVIQSEFAAGVDPNNP
jgi:hypothetical protein